MASLFKKAKGLGRWLVADAVTGKLLGAFRGVISSGASEATKEGLQGVFSSPSGEGLDSEAIFWRIVARLELTTYRRNCLAEALRQMREAKGADEEAADIFVLMVALAPVQEGEDRYPGHLILNDFMYRFSVDGNQDEDHPHQEDVDSLKENIRVVGRDIRLKGTVTKIREWFKGKITDEEFRVFLNKWREEVSREVIRLDQEIAERVDQVKFRTPWGIILSPFRWLWSLFTNRNDGEGGSQ